jgi:N-acetylglucosaminyl-diphospho-decaprenol L-rhamnosyltransferase
MTTEPYTAVVVAHDQPRQLLVTLLSLRKHAHPAEVVVVDNASSDDLAGVIRLAQLPIRHLRLARHSSLGAAFNAGLDTVGNETVLLLHADVTLDSDPGTAVAHLRQQPDIGIIGGKLYENTPPPRRLSSAGYALDEPGRIAPRAIGRGEWDWRTTDCDVDAVTDACMVVRVTTIRFDERFWFRLQDVDLCLRYRQVGYRVRFCPGLAAIHLARGSHDTRRATPQWAARQLAGQWLYHQRWCSDLPLAGHAEQRAIRGEEAEEYFRDIDVASGIGAMA